MRRILSGAPAIALAVIGLAAGAPAAAQDCGSDYMACAAAVVTSSSDGLHDDTCTQEYIACIGRMLRFY